MSLEKEKESKYLMTRLRYFKREIIKIEKKLKDEELTIKINNDKTLCQNPLIKILNDYIKNMISIYNTLLKIEDSEKGVREDNEVAKFIQNRDKK